MPSNDWLKQPLPKYDGVQKYYHGHKRSPQKIKRDIDRWYDEHPEEKALLKKLK